MSDLDQKKDAGPLPCTWNLTKVNVQQMPSMRPDLVTLRAMASWLASLSLISDYDFSAGLTRFN